mgnify:CR=1 FL=1
MKLDSEKKKKKAVAKKKEPSSEEYYATGKKRKSKKKEEEEAKTAPLSLLKIQQSKTLVTETAAVGNTAVIPKAAVDTEIDVKSREQEQDFTMLDLEKEVAEAEAQHKMLIELGIVNDCSLYGL